MRPKPFSWNEDKNDWLKAHRAASFEDVVLHIAPGYALDVIEHPNQAQYEGQRILVAEMRGYVWLAPFVETGTEIFLKTIIPSRKATKQYLGNKYDEPSAE